MKINIKLNPDNYQEKFTLLAFMILFSVFSFGQIKQEFETRIGKNLLSKKIEAFVNELPNDKKRLRFYKEIDGKKESLEVKFKHKGDNYSCEFDTDENLEDVEKLIKKRHINDNALNEMQRYLDNMFRRHKFLKVQEQYFPESNDNPSMFLKKIIGKKIKMSGYEIIIEVTKGKNRTLKEFQFNTEGKFINMRDIATSSYGHVLY